MKRRVGDDPVYSWTIETNERYPEDTKEMWRSLLFLFSLFSLRHNRATHSLDLPITRGCQFLARSSSPSPMFLHHVCGTWNYSRAKGNVACATLEIPPFIKLNPSSPKSSHSPLISLFVQRKRGVREILSQILDYANRCWIAATTNAFLC